MGMGMSVEAGAEFRDFHSFRHVLPDLVAYEKQAGAVAYSANRTRMAFGRASVFECGVLSLFAGCSVTACRNQ